MEISNLIFIEGIWGSGKTTTVQNIRNALNLCNKNSGYISDEDESLTKLYPKINNIKRFFFYYKKKWIEIIDNYNNYPNLIFENGLFSSLCQHWIENEMPEKNILEFFDKDLFANINHKFYLIHLAPKNITKSWGKITIERGIVWKEFMEIKTLEEINKNRKNKYQTIIQYIKDLDKLYRKIYSKLNISKMQIDSLKQEWTDSLRNIYKLLNIDITFNSTYKNSTIEGVYKNEDKNNTCEVTDKGNCIQIRNIFGSKKLIMYLYGIDYPIREGVESWFYLPSFGKVKIKFMEKNNKTYFSISDINVFNENFRDEFSILEHTKWIKICAV